jgi:hypothetical protein
LAAVTRVLFGVSALLALALGVAGLALALAGVVPPPVPSGCLLLALTLFLPFAVASAVWQPSGPCERRVAARSSGPPLSCFQRVEPLLEVAHLDDQVRHPPEGRPLAEAQAVGEGPEPGQELFGKRLLRESLKKE